MYILIHACTLVVTLTSTFKVLARTYMTIICTFEHERDAFVSNNRVHMHSPCTSDTGHDIHIKCYNNIEHDVIQEHVIPIQP